MRRAMTLLRIPSFVDSLVPGLTNCDSVPLARAAVGEYVVPHLMHLADGSCVGRGSVVAAAAVL